MSVIQKIQDKYGKVMAIIIALALVVFVIMLAFENGGSLFRGNTTTVGKINGKSVEFNQFRNAVEQQTQMMQQRGMNANGEMLAQQANEAAWNSEIAKILLEQEAAKLGIEVGKKELNDLLFGHNPPQELRQVFANSETGNYDPNIARQQIGQIKSKGTPEQKAQLNAFLDQIVFQRLAEKYDALLTASINFPKWMIEKENAQNSLLAKASYVQEPYVSISDSAVNVTDVEIQSYVDKHKDDFKQIETRSISYVAFSAEPNAADSAQIKQRLLALKPAFDSAKNVKTYLMTQGVNNYYDGYISANRIQVPMKDSIFKAGVGNAYGPYIDGDNYSLAKVIATKTIPDTVKIRHILIGTSQADPQTGQQIPIRDTASAKKLADSIALAIRNGANFDSLAMQFSDDPRSAKNGGVYDGVPSGQMLSEFNNFIFGNPNGTKGVVKTDFGYHYIEILSQKGSTAGYKIAYLSKPIEASQETDAEASNKATKFAAEAPDQKAFEAAVLKQEKQENLYKSLAQDIPPMGASIQGLGASRTFIKNIYAAQRGDVLAPERVGDFYVVAIVTEVNKEGILSASKARASVEPLLKNQKKAELIIKKIGSPTSLEAAAAALKKTVIVEDSLRFDAQKSALSYEPKAVGAVFNKANVNKLTEPIAGSQGVYLIKVDHIGSTPLLSANVEEARKIRTVQQRQQSQFQFLQPLKEAATIKDFRSRFF